MRLKTVLSRRVMRIGMIRDFPAARNMGYTGSNGVRVRKGKEQN